MNLKQYFFTMLTATILCWLAWIMVIINVNPFVDSGLGFLFFYLSLGLAFLGTATVLIFLIYYFFSQKDLPLFRFVKKSFQAGLFLTFLLVVLLYLQSKSYLSWWNVLVFVTVIILLLVFKKLNSREQFSS